MIIAETADSYQFVTQPDHATLAGTFAEHWGNDLFAPPEPGPPMTIAAYHHDAGWVEYDRRPHLDENGQPIDFRDMPSETWIDLYEDGIEALVTLDTYAGLLVSMHGAGLRNRRYGLSPSWPATASAYQPFIDREEARQVRLCRQLRDSNELSKRDATLLSTLHESSTGVGADSSHLWTNYKLLQAWDTLSLAFCMTPSLPNATDIENVPSSDDSADQTLTIDTIAPDTVRVTPYPFDVTPLDVSVPVRTVQKGAFESDASTARIYYEAKREQKEVTICDGDET